MATRDQGGLDAKYICLDFVLQVQVMDLLSSPRITIEPDKCGGRACIRGFRIGVTDILSLLGAGASFAEILEDYPDLEADDSGPR